MSEVNLPDSVYIGGHKRTNSIATQTDVPSGFVGCFLSLEVNGRRIDLHNKPSIRNVIDSLDIGGEIDLTASVCCKVRLNSCCYVAIVTAVITLQMIISLKSLLGQNGPMVSIAASVSHISAIPTPTKMFHYYPTNGFLVLVSS